GRGVREGGHPGRGRRRGQGRGRRRKKSRPRVVAAGKHHVRLAGRRAPSRRAAVAPEPVSNETVAGRNSQRQRATAALKANPGVSLTRVAEIAKCSRSTVSNAARELGVETRKPARKPSEPSKPPTEARVRAQRFLKDALAHGPKPVTDVEAAAERAHVDLTTLAQARGDLGIVTSRGNAGGVQAVQWSLPA